MSTLVMFYIMENGEVWCYTYRLYLGEKKWGLADVQILA
jgi:hypothetical protein